MDTALGILRISWQPPPLVLQVMTEHSDGWTNEVIYTLRNMEKVTAKKWNAT